MLLKVGELAKRTGLTVRALHHYDAIKLLCPSARSAAGYRLYNRADIERLYRRAPRWSPSCSAGSATSLRRACGSSPISSRDEAVLPGAICASVQGAS